MTAYLITMKGHPATGKSTLAAALAQSLKWPLLDKDDIKDQTLGLPNDNDLAYAILWQMAATQLRLGVSLIVDSPLAYPAMYTRAQALVAEHGARLLVVETSLTASLWRQRLQERSPDASTHKIQGWASMEAQLATYNECWRYPIDPAHHLLVDMAEPIATLREQVRQRLAL